MKFFLLIFVFLFTQNIFAQKYWIFFKDKEITNSLKISERALSRREKMKANTLIDESDLPVSSFYLQQLSEKGIEILNTSRWFNAATANLTEEQKNIVLAFPFVKNIERVRTFSGKNPLLDTASQSFLSKKTSTLHNYGVSFAQNDQIKVPDVHNLRITGRGVLVGMLDSGFRWKTHEALQNMKILKEYDFIQKDDVTENQTGDASNQDAHGTSTLSVVGGYKDGQLIGPAFGASFMLAKTEYVPTETNVEEDNWVAGMEWLEQNGVDVVNSSLGYSEFDNGQQSYTYQDMDGRTAITTKAAVIAARKGVVLCNSMGNEGNGSWHYLTSPADADSIISVGAVNNDGSYASFSSVGPTSDGRIKPDVVAQGVSVYCANSSKSLYGTSQGTSLSSPLTAGVAALILSAHPELTPVQVREALRNTANNFSSPNNTIGWGVINAYDAILYNGLVMSTDPEIIKNVDNTYSVGIYVVSKSIIKKDSIELLYTIDNGINFSSVPMTLSETFDGATFSGKYVATLSAQSSSGKIQFYVTAKDATEKIYKTPYQAPNILFDITGEVTEPPITPTIFSLEQNFPNPFNGFTTIRYTLEEKNFTTLKVYDILGREIQALVREEQDKGTKSVTFNSSNLASGVYFYKLISGKFSAVKKLVLMK